MSDSDYETISNGHHEELKEIKQIFSPLIKMAQRPTVQFPTQYKTVSKTRPNQREAKPDKKSYKQEPRPRLVDRMVPAAAAAASSGSTGTIVDFFRADRIPPPTVFQTSGIISSEAGFKVGKQSTSVLNLFKYEEGDYQLVVNAGTAFTDTGVVGKWSYQVIGNQVTLFISAFTGTTSAFVSSPNGQPLVLTGFPDEYLDGVDEQAQCVIRTATGSGPLGTVRVYKPVSQPQEIFISDSDSLSAYQWTASTGNQGWNGFAVSWLIPLP